MPRVLIAEDDDVICKLLHTIVERNGCSATVASNGAEALAALKREPFDLLVLDLMMPVVNGYEVIEHIRSMPERPAILVVTAMTGDRFLELDGDVVAAIIHKPFDTQSFGTLVADIANSMAARRASGLPPIAPEQLRLGVI